MVSGFRALLLQKLPPRWDGVGMAGRKSPLCLTWGSWVLVCCVDGADLWSLLRLPWMRSEQLLFLWGGFLSQRVGGGTSFGRVFLVSLSWLWTVMPWAQRGTGLFPTIFWVWGRRGMAAGTCRRSVAEFLLWAGDCCACVHQSCCDNSVGTEVLR